MLNQELKDLQKLSAHLRQKLMASMYRHEYFREAEDLEKWITEQMQMATSEDFGHDYEHLLVSGGAQREIVVHALQGSLPNICKWHKSNLDSYKTGCDSSQENQIGHE